MNTKQESLLQASHIGGVTLMNKGFVVAAVDTAAEKGKWT